VHTETCWREDSGGHDAPPFSAKVKMGWDLIVTPVVAHVLLPTHGDQSPQTEDTTQFTGTSGERDSDGVGVDVGLAGAVAESVTDPEGATVPDGEVEGGALAETLMVGDGEWDPRPDPVGVRLTDTVADRDTLPVRD